MGRRGFGRRIWHRLLPSLLALIFAGGASGANAEDMRLPKGWSWVVVASAAGLDEAIGIARVYGADARVTLANNGWYAVMLGPRQGSLDQARKNVVLLPADALLSRGKGYVATVWRPSSPILASATLNQGSPAHLATAGLVVSVVRESASSGWIAHIRGATRSPTGPRTFEARVHFDAAAAYPSSVKLVELDSSNQTPEIVLDSYSGGAHCCTSTAALVEQYDSSWRTVDLGTGDGEGINFEDVNGDGVSEIITYDDSFLYAFSDYASSISPIKIGTLTGSVVTDITHRSDLRHRLIQSLRGLEFIAKQSPSLWSENGFLAGWVATATVAGEGAAAWSRMLSNYQPDSIFLPTYCRIEAPEGQCPEDQRYTPPFPEALRRHLIAHGYLEAEQVSAPAQTAQAPPASATVPTPQSTAAEPAAVSPKPPEKNAEAVSGTGFYVTRDRILTNAHVVEGCEAVTTALEGHPATGRVAARDTTNDLALIEAAQPATAVARMRTGIRLGEDVAAFGYPLRGVLASTGNFTRGTVTATAGLNDDSRHLQISAPVQPGNSGGPLLDESGNVVGVIVAKLNALKVAIVTADIPQNINFAIKASIAQSFLESNNVTTTPGSQTTPMKPADIAAMAQSFSVAIECSP